MSEKRFRAKVILFGEYSVVRKSRCLVMPLDLYSGKLSFEPKYQSLSSNRELKSLLKHLKKLKRENNFNLLDIEALEFDINRGLFFDSSIPEGYGAGSSGALCAAIFDKYSQDSSEQNMEELKNHFALIESHFHGSSSGIDPLLSYIDRPLMYGVNEGIQLVDLPNNTKGEHTFFLLDTGRPRRTEPLIKLFMEKLKNTNFLNLVDVDLKDMNDKLIDSFLNQDNKGLETILNKLSFFQYEEMRPMIPDLFVDLWKESLNTDTFSLKLCGAGGGGFILGMSNNFAQFRKEYPDLEVRALLKF